MLFNLTSQGVSEPAHPDACYQPLMTSEDQHRHYYIAFQVVLADRNQSAAQFGWWQACSVRGEVGPGWFPPSLFVLLSTDALPTTASTQKCLSLPITTPTPQPLKPKGPAITQLFKLSQEPVSLPPPPPIHHPPFSCPPPPHLSLLPPKCIPAWQTTWDFTSPLKSAASGNHSSPCNILVFKGIRDWGGNQPGNLLYSSCLLIVAGGKKSESRFLSGDHNWSLMFSSFLYITLEYLFPCLWWFLHMKHLLSRCLLLKSFFILF